MGLPGAGCGLWCEPGTSRASVFRVSRRHAFDGGAAACLSPLPAVSREGCVRFRGRAHRPPHPFVGTVRRAHRRPLPRTVGSCQQGLFDGQCAGTVPRTYRGLGTRKPRLPMCGDGAPHLPGVGQPQTTMTNVRGRRPAPTGGWTNRKPRRPMCGDGAPHLPGVGQPQTATANVRGRFPAPTGGWIAANRDGRCAGTVPRTCRGLDKPQTATNHSKKIKQ